MSKLKLVTIVGTRPELIRLSRCINKFDEVFDHILIHTGQNYDYKLNEIFFEELKIRKPDFYLNVVGSNLGETIGNVISKSYSKLSEIQPDALIVLGDTNSVLCTISAKRLKIPIFHMEAGNRCFDSNVPEEINRKISDHISDINITYTENSRRYLLSEGFRKDHVFVSGSPMVEVLDYYNDEIEKSKILEKFDLEKGNYFVVSMHREENVDNSENFQTLINSINSVAATYSLPILFSTHPRTRKILDSTNDLFIHPLIKIVEPLGFLDYIYLQKNSFMVLSDSGTISEESAICDFRAISLRTTTERPEAIDFGSIILAGIDSKSILNSVNINLSLFKEQKSISIPLEYSFKNCSERIVKIIQGYTNVVNRETWMKKTKI